MPSMRAQSELEDLLDLEVNGFTDSDTRVGADVCRPYEGARRDSSANQENVASTVSVRFVVGLLDFCRDAPSL